MGSDDLKQAFILAVGARAYRADIATVLELKAWAVRKRLQRAKIPAPKPPNIYTLPALREAWLRFQQGDSLRRGVELWDCDDQQGKPRAPYSSYDIGEIEESVGTISTRTIARRLNREPAALNEQIRAMGLSRRAFGCTVNKLSALLELPRKAIQHLLDTNVLRWYKQGKRAKIHYEDFDAMTAGYHSLGWGISGVPAHPGKVRHRGEIDLTEEERLAFFRELAEDDGL